MKKKTVINLLTTATLSATLLGSFSLGDNGFKPQTVQAATSYKVKLTHNAYIYNYRGKKNIKKVLKKGHVYRVYRTKQIHGKKYLYLGHEKYIKAANAKSNKKKANYLFKVKVTGAGFVYPTYKDTGDSNLAVGGTKKVYQQAKDSNGTTWYEIGTNKWIISTDTDRPITTSTTSKVDNNIKNNNSYSTDTKSTTSTKPEATSSNQSAKYTKSEFASKVEDIFITKINDLRRSKGIAPFEQDNTLSNYAKIRAAEVNTDFSHTRPNGERTQYGEVLLGGSTTPLSKPEIVAEGIVHRFIYDDSASNWQHRDILLNPRYTHIGAGLAWDLRDNSNYAFVANINY